MSEDARFSELIGLPNETDVLEVAVRLAANLAGEEGRAIYFGIEGELGVVLAEHDPKGMAAPSFVWLADHRALRQVVQTGQPQQTEFTEAEVSGSAAKGVERLGLSSGAAAPVFVKGRLHGVLAVGGRGAQINAFARLVDLARAVEAGLGQVHEGTA